MLSSEGAFGPAYEAYTHVERAPDGSDPYDLLLSPFVRPFARNSKWLGIAVTQLGRHSPVNLRGLLRVPRCLSSKTVSLIARGCFALYRAGQGDEWRTRGLKALSQLLELRSQHPKGLACWGYAFPWRSRLLYLPPGAPSGVCTVFAAQALLDGFEVTNDSQYLDAARSACDFILQDLPRHEDGDAICFSYIPNAQVSVHNANLLAAALLARAFSVTSHIEIAELVPRAVAFALRDQNHDGSWYYDAPPDRIRLMIDCYHTVFVLQSLRDIERTLGLDTRDAVGRGEAFWRAHLMDADGSPRRTVGRKHPVDIRDVAQSLLWLCDPDLGQDWGMWERTFAWAEAHMRHRKGHYIFELHATGRIGNSLYYPRMQAWMFYALARAGELLVSAGSREGVTGDS